MKLTWIWIVKTITNWIFPVGIIPLIYCTITHPLTVLLWLVLGMAGFAFGMLTWKYHLSRRDDWATSPMGRISWKIRSSFWQSLSFCCTGALVYTIIFLFME